MANPPVAIGMPVFNGEPYLEGAIQSLLSQDYGDYTLIVSDNASTDNSLDIVREYAERDNRIHVHESDVNHGGAWNFNRVFQLSRSTYFKWAASDDICEPTFLTSCIRAMESDLQNAVLVYPRTMLIDDNGTPIREDRSDWEMGLDRPGSARRAAEFIRWHTLCNSLFGLIRREALERTRLLQPWTASDLVLHCELLLQGPYKKIDEILFNRRIHSDQAMVKNKSTEEKRRWFDGKFSGERDKPYSRLLREYMRSVSNSHLKGGARIGAYAMVARAALRRHARALLRESFSR